MLSAQDQSKTTDSAQSLARQLLGPMDIPKVQYGNVGMGCSTLRNVPARRLEDRIRELCRKALTANKSELREVLSDLRLALHEHTERLRKVAIMKLTSTRKQPPDERRSA